MNENSESKITIYLFLIVIGIILFLFFKGVSTKPTENTNEQSQVVVKPKKVETEGVQYLDLTAKGGYAPSVINAKAGIETIVRIKTSSTFDCSSAFTIPKLNIRKNLPPTGTTDIAIGAQSKGTKLLGTCSMGMYSFNMNFN